LTEIVENVYNRYSRYRNRDIILYSTVVPAEAKAGKLEHTINFWGSNLGVDLWHKPNEL
jgi:hypothetical protein